jgi:carboxypeptidase PM20D1
MQTVIRRIVVVLGALVLMLLVVFAFKTAMLSSRQLQVPVVAPVTVDAAAASRLASAVRLQTISSHDDEHANADAFNSLHAHIQSSFPRLHAILKRELIGSYGLLYTWPGTDARLNPVLLMAHQDVVPVAPGTEKDWTHAPFSGDIADGFVWGRGAWDNKSNLMSQMEAVELLVTAGFQPRQTVMLFYGQDEEVYGARGAAVLAARLKRDNVRVDFVLDEGTLVIEGMLPGLEKPAAMVGVAEKGYLTVQINASAAPGHSSMPSPVAGKSAIGMMSATLARLETNQFPVRIAGVAGDMLESLAPEMSLVNRIAFANLWLTRPVIESQLSRGPATAAMMRTTTALTIVSAGNRDNVLPGRASAMVNFRLLPGDTSDMVIEHITKVAGELPVKAEKAAGFSEASRVGRTDARGFAAINKTMRELHPDIVVAPSLMLGATDARYMDAVADNVYRYSPVRAGPNDLSRFHGTNERISVANYTEMVQFYHQLLRNLNSSTP